MLSSVEIKCTFVHPKTIEIDEPTFMPSILQENLASHATACKHTAQQCHDVAGISRHGKGAYLYFNASVRLPHHGICDVLHGP